MGNVMITLIEGKTIKEIRTMSFYINLKLICDVVSLYVRVDTGTWYRFTTSDGRNIIELLKEEPKEILLNEIKDEFAYPIKIINSNYIDKKIEIIQEYRYRDKIDELNGFYIKLNDKLGFSLIEENGCVKIIDGIKLDNGFSLV